jgi:hypothetical protein
VKVKANGLTPTGFVAVTLPTGETLRARLDRGRATLVLPKFAKPGSRVLVVTYDGDARTESATIQHEIDVVRR